MIRPLLADNQAIFRAGIARVLESQPDVRVLGQCDTAAAVPDLVAGTRNCVLLLAESLGADMDRVFAAATANGTRIVLMTESEAEPPPSILRRIDGLLTRHATSAELLHCLRRVALGERCVQSPEAPPDEVGHSILSLLNQRELQIIGYVVQGWKNRQIADQLGTKEQVVKNYLRTIYDKTGASDRLELALFTLHHRALAEAAAKASGASRKPDAT